MTIVTEDDFKNNFPTGLEPPRQLLKLLSYQNSITGYYSDYFYLHGNGKLFADRYFGDKTIADQFVVFGHDSDGCLYAFWRHKQQSLDNTPVVFLDSDGDSSVVLSDTIDGFLALLSLGVEELGHALTTSTWANKFSNDQNVIQFRKWLHDELGIEVPRKPEQILNEAKQNQPDLIEWIQENLL